MTTKQKIIILVLGVMLVIVVVGGIINRSRISELGDRILQRENEEIDDVKETNNEVFEISKEQEKSRSAESFTPTINQDIELTKPQEEAPASPNSEAKLGVFEIQIAKNGYTPNTIAVKQNNIVQLRLIAVDGDYDFSIPALGLYRVVKKGETKQAMFGARTSGTFSFSCRDFCPNGKIIQGQLVVLP